MYELIQVGENTFYMDCPSKVGFFKVANDEVCLIDSGSDKDVAKKVKKILDDNGWKLKVIYNTHSHADHIGGNQYLQSQTNCKIYAKEMEYCFTKYPILESTMLYGGFSMDGLHNKFLMAKESSVEFLTKDVLVSGLEIIALPGHSFDMVGFRTNDDVVFLADCLSSEEIINKYKVGFIYDVKAYIDTLEMVKTFTAKCFVPSHTNVMIDIVSLAQFNIDTTKEIAEKIKEIVSIPKTFDEILLDVFDFYGLDMTLQQNVLVGSTIKSYLSYLKNKDEVTFFFEKNKMLWEVKK